MVAKVSVIIPVYNVEKYVRDCVMSVMNQTLTDIEIICVDDCSDDNSMKIVEELARQDNRIKTMYNETNVGVSASRNRAMESATGEYIYFLDSDDMIISEAMETLYSYSVEKCLDVLYFDTKQICENCEIEKKWSIYEAFHVVCVANPINGKDMLNMFVDSDDWDVSVCRQFYRREFIKNLEVKFRENVRFGEDNLFSLEVILSASRTCCMPYKVHIYRRRPESLTTMQSGMQERLVCIAYSYNLYRYYMTKYRENKLYNDIAWMARAASRHVLALYRQLDVLGLELLYGCSNELETIRAITVSLYGGHFPHKLSQGLMTDIRHAKHVVIYGAGKVGAGLLELLEEREIKVDCFAVTSGGGSTYHGYDVRNIALLEYEKKDTIILIAVIKNSEEMRTAAYENGFYNVISFEWKKGIPVEIR